VSSTAKTVSALVLDQKHIYLGKTKVYLTPSALKLTTIGDKFRFSLISKAPKWDVVVYRNDDRLVCRTPLKTFCDQGGLFSNMVIQLKARNTPPGGKRTTKKIAGTTWERTTWSRIVFECLQLKGNAAPQAETILHAAYKMPTNGQIPLRWEGELVGRDIVTRLREDCHRVFLITDSIKRVDVPASEFNVPTGYTNEKSITRIVIGDQKRLKETGVNVLFDY